MTRTSETTRSEAVAALRLLVPPGARLYTLLQHASKSGMTRHVSVILPVLRDGQPDLRDITWLVGRALDRRRNARDGGLVITGVGMDMGFSIVYDLGRVLYQDRFTCLGEGCPSNDHSNGDRDYTPHLHSDGGYCLRHDWI